MSATFEGGKGLLPAGVEADATFPEVSDYEIPAYTQPYKVRCPERSAEVRPISPSTLFLGPRTVFASFLLYLHLSGASLVVAAGSEARDLPVGRWTCKIEYGHWIIERRADGSFDKRPRKVFGSNDGG
jgi:hypothetical protein